MASKVDHGVSIPFTIPVPAHVVGKIKDGGISSMLSQNKTIDPIIKDAIQALDEGVSAGLKKLEAAPEKALLQTPKEPFTLQVKGEQLSEKWPGEPFFVQVCGLTTIRELAKAIACEHNRVANSMRLVVMGKTIYNVGLVMSVPDKSLNLNEVSRHFLIKGSERD